MPEIAGAAGWVLRRTWAANRRLALGLVVIVLARGVLPAGIALSIRGLINAALAPDAAFRDLVGWLVVGFTVALLEALTPLTNRYLLQRTFDALDLDLTTAVLEQSAKLEVTTLEDAGNRDALDRIQQDTSGPVAQCLANLQAVCTAVIESVLMLAILTYLEPWVLLIAGPVAVPYLYYRWRGARLRYRADISWTAKRRWTRYFVSHTMSPEHATETRMLGLAPLFVDRLRSVMGDLHAGAKKQYWRDYAGAAIFAAVTTIAIYVLFARVANSVIEGRLTVGDIAVFAGISARLRATLELLISSLSIFVQQSLHVQNLRNFLSLAATAPRAAMAVEPQQRGLVDLDDVTFTYPGSTTPSLTEVSLRIEPGEVVALVGENGAGKTTLVKLISGIYQPDSGRITADGVDHIAFLSQDIARYEASAGDNVAYGDWPRLLGNDAQLREAAELAGIDEFIATLPRGYDTNIGPEFGEHDLSGGQWQAIAGARALLRDASLVILDEPTAHLDARAEFALYSRFRDIAAGRTTILVTHRLSTLAMADRIIVLDQGRIVEDGTHAELLALDGIYAELSELQRRQLDLRN